MEAIKTCVRNIVSVLGNIFFSIIFVLSRSPKLKDTKYYVSICAIFKDEARYLVEWIEYHRLVGVDHLYLYNNFSSDDYQMILKPYIEDGYVTLVEWPYELAQIPAYQHCYDKFGSETYWLMFIDIDEFICPLYSTDIKDWIKRYEKYPSIIMYWLMFGTNGLIDYDPAKLVIEQYTCSWRSIRNVGKIALNTSFKPVKMYHHYIFCWVKFMGIKFKVPSINETRKFIFYYKDHEIPKKNSIQINHYWSKCLSEYVRKIDKGDMFSKGNDQIRKRMDFFYWHEHQNVSENKVIYRFLAELKIQLKHINIKFK